ncbi:MAG: PDZ domain-containing protein, partial [Bacteroidota bacterium]
LREGDVLYKLNSKRIKNSSDVSEALADTKSGDAVNVVYFREGVKISDFVKLGESAQTRFVERRVRTFDDIKERKINCAALGVYTGVSSKQEGARIVRIIENSGAERAGLQRNDIITALDNAPVGDYDELHETIGKYEPGSVVEVKYLREGKEMSTSAVLTQWVELPEFSEKPAYQQVTCEELPPLENIQVTPQAEIEEVAEVQIPVDRNLVLEDFSVFPNPTEGPVTISFRGESVPTEITLTDVNGRQVYQDKLQKFDGIYNNEINLNRIPSGNLFLTVTQGEKIFTETIIRQ